VREVPVSLVGNGLIISCGTYEGVVRRAILEWKDHDDEEVGKVFAHVLSELIVKAFRSEIVRSSDEICVVPIPSSWRSAVRRGRVQTYDLVRALTAELGEYGVDAECCHCLKFARTRTKSVQDSSAHQRVARLRTRIRVVGRRIPPHGSTVILVDDIVTTGATLLNCARALRRAGVKVSAAFSLASTVERDSAVLG
jgi:predicted amidophosphoribosyltransferase